MDTFQKQHLADSIEGEYQLKDDVLIKSDGKIELAAFQRHIPKKGQPKRYLTLINFSEEPLMTWEQAVSGEDSRLYLSGLFPIKGKKNSYAFDIEKNYFDLVLKNDEQAEIKRATRAKALEFKGGING